MPAGMREAAVERLASGLTYLGALGLEQPGCLVLLEPCLGSGEGATATQPHRAAAC